LAADVGVLQRLPHLIGEGRTRELAYTARDLLGSEAARIGLLNDCFVDRDTLMRQVMTIARALATKSPLAMRGTKYAITYARDHCVTDGLEQIATWNSATLISDDLTEAVAAASEGRSAVFGY
jgi:enoyl-CoA hydratase